MKDRSRLHVDQVAARRDGLEVAEVLLVDGDGDENGLAKESEVCIGMRCPHRRWATDQRDAEESPRNEGCALPNTLTVRRRSQEGPRVRPVDATGNASPRPTCRPFLPADAQAASVGSVPVVNRQSCARDPKHVCLPPAAHPFLRCHPLPLCSLRVSWAGPNRTMDCCRLTCISRWPRRRRGA